MVYMVYFPNKIKFLKVFLCLLVSVLWKKLGANTNKFILTTYWGLFHTRHQWSNFSCCTSFNPHNILMKWHWVPQSSSVMLMLAFCLDSSSLSALLFLYPSSMSFLLGGFLGSRKAVQSKHETTIFFLKKMFIAR